MTLTLTKIFNAFMRPQHLAEALAAKDAQMADALAAKDMQMDAMLDAQRYDVFMRERSAIRQSAGSCRGCAHGLC